MCGLTGALARQLDALDMSIFHDLMHVSTLRGTDGAGIVTVPAKHKKDIKCFRTLRTGSELVWYSQDYAAEIKGHHTLVMGHCRYPTSGDATLASVHPHVSGHIYGMHNGTMETVNGDKVTKKSNDSKMLFDNIAQYGLKTTVNNSEGALALSYINTRDGTLNFYRNSKRNLYFGYPEEGTTTVFWASELRFLNMILGRSLKDGKFRVVSLPPDTHWMFSIRPAGNLVKLLEETSLKAPEVVGLLPAPSIPPTVIHVPDTVEQTYHATLAGHCLRAVELEVVFKQGCRNCSQPAQWQDFCSSKMHFIRQKEFICDDCYEHDPPSRQWVDSVNGKKIA
jgi:hypothetical protein